MNIDEILGTLAKAEHGYENGVSTLSDREYDNLKDQAIAYLTSNDSTHPYLSKVGVSEISEHWEKTPHRYPLGSLSKVNTADQITTWLTRNANFPVVIQEKLDGISIELVYQSGKLVSAVTRGDGEIGDNIFSNVVRMKGVPSHIAYKSALHVRGEILFLHNDFAKFQDDSGGGKNPRNMASGIAKRLDGTNANLLTVLVYDILNMQDTNLSTETDVLNLLSQLNFSVVESQVCSSISEVVSYYDNYQNGHRTKIDRDIDGLVIKTNEWQHPGEDWGNPKNKVAWKFQHQYAESVVLDIEWNVNGGHITPVAILQPTELAGVTIRRASLSNIELALKKGIGVGAKVLISRRNDVIPHVEEVLIAGQIITAPTKCPCCNGKVERELNTSGEELNWIICANEKCPSKAKRSIMNWLRVHNSKNIGSASIAQLIEMNVIANLPDLLRLPSDQNKQRLMMTLDGFGKRKVTEIVQQISATLKTDVIKLLNASDFSGLGASTFEKVIDQMKEESIAISVDSVLKYIDTADLTQIQGIGGEKSIRLKREATRKLPLIDELLSIVEVEEYLTIAGTGLTGVTFCFTGALESMGRNEATNIIVSMGGQVTSVNSKLSYLVTNDPTSNTGKAKKARDLGTQVISEDQFLALIGRTPTPKPVEVVTSPSLNSPIFQF